MVAVLLVVVLLTALEMMDLQTNLLPLSTLSAEMTVSVLIPSDAIHPPLLEITMVVVPTEMETTAWLISLARPALPTLTATMMVVLDPTNLNVILLLELVLNAAPTMTAMELERSSTVMMTDSAQPVLSSVQEFLVKTMMDLLVRATLTPTVILSPIFA
jgi:hypothetical protein